MVPLSPVVVKGWGLAIGHAVMSDGWRSFGVAGGGIRRVVGGAQVQAAVFHPIILHGVACSDILPKLLEFGGAQTSCNRVTNRFRDKRSHKNSHYSNLPFSNNV